MKYSKTQIGIIAHIMRIKAEGHKYEDVKRNLKLYYDANSFDYPYEYLENMFDQVWGNTIEVVDEDDLK